jgi:hypothetical protein
MATAAQAIADAFLAMLYSSFIIQTLHNFLYILYIKFIIKLI